METILQELITGDKLQELGLKEVAENTYENDVIRVSKFFYPKHGWIEGKWTVHLVGSVPHRVRFQYQYMNQIEGLYFYLTGQELKR